MTHSTSGRFRRADLAHGRDHDLVASATVNDDAGSTFTAELATEPALHAFLDMIEHYPGRMSTVRMFLKPVGYHPAREFPVEFVPSCLFFDLDHGRDAAAAGLLVLDAEGTSHQWLTRGSGRADVTLTVDPFNPEFTRFPADSVVTIADVRDLAVHWAFGDVYPPSGAPLRAATEHEASWPVGSTY